VVVCDDHRTMREALARYLRAQPAIATVQPAANADEAVRLLRQGADVLVLDLWLHADESGLEVLEAMRHLRITAPVLVLGAHAEPHGDELAVVARALALGAIGYIPKTATPEAVYDAVLDVSHGRAVLPPDALDPLLRRLRSEIDAAEQSRCVLSRLTGREREVLRLLAQGLGRADIAERLDLSFNTVRTHIGHLLEKLGVNSQLAAAARGRALLDAAASDPTPMHTIALNDEIDVRDPSPASSRTTDDAAADGA